MTGGITARVLLLSVTAVATSVAQQPKRMTWKVDGLEREALVFAPTAQAANGKFPVILVFHGHGGNMRGFANQTHFQLAWPEAIVVSLQGLPIESNRDPGGKKPGWDSGPEALTEQHNQDLDLVDTVLATLHRNFQVDDARIYATGFSNGAFMTFLLWTARSSTFAAIAPVAGLIRDWKPPVPRPVIYIGGKKDPLVKPDSQKKTVSAVRMIDGANGAGQQCGPDCTFFASTTGTPVPVITHDGGHEFPPFATQAIVAFFKNHQLKR